MERRREGPDDEDRLLGRVDEYELLACAGRARREEAGEVSISGEPALRAACPSIAAGARCAPKRQQNRTQKERERTVSPIGLFPYLSPTRSTAPSTTSAAWPSASTGPSASAPARAAPRAACSERSSAAATARVASSGTLTAARRDCSLDLSGRRGAVGRAGGGGQGAARREEEERTEHAQVERARGGGQVREGRGRVGCECLVRQCLGVCSRRKEPGDRVGGARVVWVSAPGRARRDEGRVKGEGRTGVDERVERVDLDERGQRAFGPRRAGRLAACVEGRGEGGGQGHDQRGSRSEAHARWGGETTLQQAVASEGTDRRPRAGCRAAPGEGCLSTSGRRCGREGGRQ